MNVILIGLRASGKSNISRRLSILSKRPVLSTDLLISYENGGRTIAEIVASHNGDWRPFRDMEYAVACKVASLDGVIVDAGGGIVVEWDAEGREVYSERKMSVLKRNGFVVWLQGDVQRLAHKVQNDVTRPALSDRVAAEEIMRQRLPFYQHAADLIVNIEGCTRKQLTEEIFRQLPQGFGLGSKSVSADKRAIQPTLDSNQCISAKNN